MIVEHLIDQKWITQVVVLKYWGCFFKPLIPTNPQYYEEREEL